MHRAQRKMSGAALPWEFFDELPLGVVHLSDDGAVRWANPSARQLLDGPAGAQLRRALTDILARVGTLRCVETSLIVRPLAIGLASFQPNHCLKCGCCRTKRSDH